MSYISSQEKSSLEMKMKEKKESYVMPTSDGIAQLASMGMIGGYGGNSNEKKGKRTKDEYRAELSRVRKELAREKERLKEMKGKEREEVEAVRRVMEEEGKERVREMKVRLGKEEVAGTNRGEWGWKGMEGNGRKWKERERRGIERDRGKRVNDVCMYVVYMYSSMCVCNVDAVCSVCMMQCGRQFAPCLWHPL